MTFATEPQENSIEH